jgi:hypothetical protein
MGASQYLPSVITAISAFIIIQRGWEVDCPHRPYIGAAINVTGWLRERGFPFDLNVFDGVVFMKQQVFVQPTATIPTGSLKWDWARKNIFGVEIPVSAITSKLTKKSGSK